jgi:transposase-like protein
MSVTRRKYTPEYRVEAAHRVIDSGRTIAEVARDLGVSEQLLGRWVHDERARELAASAPVEVETPLTETERAELLRLRARVTEQERKLREREEDVEFLKKASAYFAAMQPK